MSTVEYRFYVEGFADSVLIEMLHIHRRFIQKADGLHRIAKAMESQLKNYHAIIIGIIDLDKKNIPPYFNDFDTIETPDNFIVKHKKNTNQFLILLKPAIEKWLLYAAEGFHACIEKFETPTELRKLKTKTKRESILRDMHFKSFIRCLHKNQSSPIVLLKNHLEFIIKKA